MVNFELGEEIRKDGIFNMSRPVYGRSRVRFPSGTQIFSLSHARDMLNIPSFLNLFLLVFCNV